jgi:ABC-type glycerol-3-phosphate transport system substrate-binding protein
MQRVEPISRRIQDGGIGHRWRNRRRALVFVGAFALVLAACSGGDDAASTAAVQDGSGPTTAATNTSTTVVLPVGCSGDRAHSDA